MLAIEANILQARHCAGGYYAETRNRKPEELTQPSQNVRFTLDGEAKTRPGYESTAIDLAETGAEAISRHVIRYDTTFFAVNKKVKYFNWSNSTVYDTGVSLTADLTCLDEFKGDLFGINTTDGLQYFNISRLTQAASSGAGSVFIETDAAARLSGIGLATGTIRIAGTNYAYTAINVTTGQITLSGTLVASYTAGMITTVHNAYTTAPKGSKLAFWANSLNIIGVESGISDTPSYTLYFSDFALADSYNNIVSFPTANRTADFNSKLLDIVPTKDYLYLFTDRETYSIARDQVNAATGSRIPQIFSAQYGVVNSRSVAVMDNSIAWITQNKRIMFGQVRVEAGAISIDIAEQFDSPVKELLDYADDNQSNAFVYYLTKSKELHVKLGISGQTIELVYDNNIKAWCPPDTNKYFVDTFERSGEAYATVEDDDTVYLLNVGKTDDGADIETVIAFGEFQGQDSRTTFDIKSISVSGSIDYGTQVLYKPIMNYKNGTQNTVSFLVGAMFDGFSLGEEECGLFVLGGSGTIEESREIDVPLSNYPAIVHSYQPIFTSLGENSAFSIKSWSLPRKEYTTFIATTI